MEGCPKCGQAARADRLARHREKVHGSKMGQDKREQELAAQLAAAWDARLNQPSEAVDKQLRKTQEPGKVQCPHCHAAILEKRLQKHMRKVHPRRAPCPGCQGSAVAEWMIGGLYFHGWGVIRDFTEAATWYRRAAEAGVPVAQWDLGMMYY